MRFRELKHQLYENLEAIAHKWPTGSEDHEGQKWRRFELNEQRDVHAAMVYFGKAYEQASVPAEGSAKDASSVSFDVLIQNARHRLQAPLCTPSRAECMIV